MAVREKYYIKVRGDCLGELVPMGTAILVEPGEEIRPLDLVVIIFDPTTAGPWAKFRESISDDGLGGMAKIFLSAYQRDGETIGLFGSLNPPAIAVIPMSAVIAVDRATFEGECNGLEREAIAMLLPFADPHLAQKEAA